MALSDEISSGDRRRGLVAMRDHLATLLESADANVAAQIAARLQAVMDAIDALPAQSGESKTDQVRRKREARRAKTAS